MKTLLPIGAMMGLALVVSSCVTYTGVSKSPQGELYISGATNYFVFSSPWVRRCDIDGMKLNCVELTESPPPAKGATDGTGAPASSAEPASSSAPEAPAPAPEPKATPAKGKK